MAMDSSNDNSLTYTPVRVANYADISGGGGGGDVTVVAALPAGTNNIGDVDIASALPAGTNAIGKLAANSGVDIGDVDVTSVAPASATSGFVLSVTTAGTRVQLTAGACQHGFWLTARRGNTGSVFVGGSDVSSSVYGADLLQGERMWLPLSNTNLIYIDSATNGDGVSVERC